MFPFKSVFTHFSFGTTDSFSLPARRSFALLLLLITLYGTYLRIGDQASKDLWLDEAWRAQTIVSIPSLFSPALFSPPMPVQLTETFFGKLGISIFGKTELAFRIWPLLFSLGALFGFAYLAFHLFSPIVGSLILFFFANSYGLVEHAHEFKPYAFESFICVLAVILVLTLEQKNTKNWTSILWLFLLISVAALNLFPFFLFLVPLYFWKREEQKLSVSEATLLSLPFLLFALIYLEYSAKLSAENTFRFWKDFYLTDKEHILRFLSETAPSHLTWYVTSVLSLSKIPLFCSGFVLSVLLFISPVLMFIRKNLLFLFCTFPLLVQFILSLLGLYPVMTRVATFTTVFFLLSIGFFLEVLLEKLLPKKKPFIRPIVLGIMALCFAGFALKHPRATNPGTRMHRQPVKNFISLIDSKGLEGDIVALSYPAEFVFSFYSSHQDNYFVRESLRSHWGYNEKTAEEFLTRLRSSFPGKEFWVLSSHRVHQYEPLKKIFHKKGIVIKTDIKTPKSFLFRGTLPEPGYLP